MNTSTGSDLAFPAGAQMLRYRQSSPPSISTFDVEIWMHDDEKLAASRTSSHGGTGCGSRQRRSPIGGAAYGMPRHTATSPSMRPRTAPAVVATTAGPDGG